MAWEFSHHELKHIASQYIRPIIVVHSDDDKENLVGVMQEYDIMGIGVKVERECPPDRVYVLEGSALPIPPGKHPEFPQGRDWEPWMAKVAQRNPADMEDTRGWWLDPPPPIGGIAPPPEEDDEEGDA